MAVAPPQSFDRHRSIYNPLRLMGKPAVLPDKSLPSSPGKKEPGDLPSVPELASRLLAWYASHARVLPWRGQSDPYAIWVAEIMLQQTQVAKVIPYYARWMERFPDLEMLASASQQEVLTFWEGLGYYSRARNLHRAAQIVCKQYDGRLPQDVKELLRLPGIGQYTAGAIASIAFGKDQPTLDGNIRRVLARVFDIALPAGSRESEQILRELAAKSLPPGRAGDFNQALMDLGATVCTPRQITRQGGPDCLHCPLKDICKAYAWGLQDERPVTLRKSRTPHHRVTAAVIWRDGRVLIGQRPATGLLGGLWEFPGGKLQPGENLTTGLSREIKEELGLQIQVGQPLGIYRHAYTHFRVTVHAFECTLAVGEPLRLQHDALAWAAPGELCNYPMGKIDRLIANQLSHN